MAWRARCRAFVEARVIPFCDDWDVNGYPKELHRELYDAGIGGAIFPPAFGGTPPEGYATPLFALSIRPL